MGSSLSRERGPEKGFYWVVQREDNKQLDFLDVVCTLYDTYRAVPVDGRSELLRRRLTDLPWLKGTLTVRQNPTSFLRWQDASGKWVTWSTQALCALYPSIENIMSMEDLAYAVLSAKPVPMRLYRAWANGADNQNSIPDQAVARRSDLPEGLRLWFETWMAECHTRVGRHVGLYWLVPLWWWVLAERLSGWGDPIRLVRRSIAACPVRTVNTSVCTGLPPGCGVRVHHWAPGTWKQWVSLAGFVMQYQCQVLVSPVGSLKRQREGVRRPDTLPLDPSHDHLFVLTVGGFPVATAVVQPAGVYNPYLYIGNICSHTHSKGGLMLLQHLKSFAAATSARGVKLSAWGSEQIHIYRAQDFQSDPEYTDGREMYWNVAEEEAGLPPPMP